MKAVELARLLLAHPDLEVRVECCEGMVMPLDEDMPLEPLTFDFGESRKPYLIIRMQEDT